MFDQFLISLFSSVLSLLENLYLFTYYHAIWVSLITGLLIPMIAFDRVEKGKRPPLLYRLMVISIVFGILLGPLVNWALPTLIKETQYWAGIAPQQVHYDERQWLLIPLFVLGMMLHIVIRRHTSTKWNEIKLGLTKRTQAEREVRTDVRHVRDLLPDTALYDPEDYIDLNKGVFVGLDVHKKPQYIPLNELQKQHADILGTTGAGKGVASGLILYQLIKADEGVFVLDPKNDEWAPHLLKYACEKAGKPFYLIDLNKDIPQLDLLAQATPAQIEELLVAGFSFAEKGDIADFYRIDDRKAARKAPQLASDEERKTFTDLFHSDYVQGLQDSVKAFYGKMEELSEVSSINAPNGLNLQRIFEDGGCCYVIGSLRNAKIIMAQKMILIRLFQLAEMRDRVNTTPKPIAIFLDELKYHISKAAIEGLGAARDKGIHLFLAHQSVEDLRDCPADLNSDAVVGAVVENTKFKLVYKLQDPDTAEWVAKMSGTILVDDETRYVQSNATLSEIVEDKRNIRMAERYFVDTNMLLNLPPFVSYIFTASDVPKPSLISPIKVQKQPLSIFGTPINEAQHQHDNEENITPEEIPETITSTPEETPTNGATITSTDEKKASIEPKKESVKPIQFNAKTEPEEPEEPEENNAASEEHNTQPINALKEDTDQALKQINL